MFIYLLNFKPKCTRCNWSTCFLKTPITVVRYRGMFSFLFSLNLIWKKRQCNSKRQFNSKFGNQNETFNWKHIFMFLLAIKSFSLLLKQLQKLTLWKRKSIWKHIGVFWLSLCSAIPSKHSRSYNSVMTTMSFLPIQNKNDSPKTFKTRMLYLTTARILNDNF